MSLEQLFPDGLQQGIPTKVKQQDYSTCLPMEESLQECVSTISLMEQSQTLAFIKSLPAASFIEEITLQPDDDTADVSNIVISIDTENRRLVGMQNGKIFKVLFDGLITLSSIEKVYSSSTEFKKFYNLKLENADGLIETVQIEAKSYYQKAFSKILEFPELTFSSTFPNGTSHMKDYLSDLLKNLKSVPVHVTYMFSGWTQIENHWRYLHGNLPDVTTDRCLPVNFDATTAFNAFFPLAQKMLTSAENNSAVFLHSHLGYLERIFDLAGFRPHYILFLKGQTNSGKTSLLTELSGSMMYEQNSPLARLEDTRSYLEGIIQEMQDSLLLIDDVHPAKGQMEKDIKSNLQLIVRAYGDSQTRGKRGFDRKSLEKVKIHGAAWITGEYLQLDGESSLLRVLSIDVGNNGIDKTVLTQLQQNRLMTKQYYAGYIEYLENTFDSWIKYFAESLSNKRKKWRIMLSNNIGRTIDIAVCLDFIADTVVGYASSLHINLNSWKTLVEQAIHSLFITKIQLDEAQNPINIFKTTLKEFYDDGTLKIAMDKAEFKNHLNYIGYIEGNYLIIINGIIFDMIDKRCSEKGIVYLKLSLEDLFNAGLVKDKTIKRFSQNRLDHTRPTMISFLKSNILL